MLPSATVDPTKNSYFSVPDNHTSLSSEGLTQNQPNDFTTGLENLNQYIVQTISRTIVDEGEKPILPGTVYRAYDVGMTFNENYVDQMYVMDGRRLTVQLFDST